jgi:hypothetical protein
MSSARLNRGGEINESGRLGRHCSGSNLFRAMPASIRSYFANTLATFSGKPLCGPTVVACVTVMLELGPELLLSPPPPPPHPATVTSSTSAPPARIHRRERTAEVSVTRQTIIITPVHGTFVDRDELLLPRPIPA